MITVNKKEFINILKNNSKTTIKKTKTRQHLEGITFDFLYDNKLNIVSTSGYEIQINNISYSGNKEHNFILNNEDTKKFIKDISKNKTSSDNLNIIIYDNYIKIIDNDKSYNINKILGNNFNYMHLIPYEGKKDISFDEGLKKILTIELNNDEITQLYNTVKELYKKYNAKKSDLIISFLNKKIAVNIICYSDKYKHKIEKIEHKIINSHTIEEYTILSKSEAFFNMLSFYKSKDQNNKIIIKLYDTSIYKVIDNKNTYLLINSISDEEENQNIINKIQKDIKNIAYEYKKAN